MPSFARAFAGIAALCLLLSAPPAAAIPMDPADAPPCPEAPFPGVMLLCFDEEPSGSATSAQDYPMASVVDALVLSEADAAFLLGFDTSSWATTGDQGILNVLVAVVEFWFDAPIDFFRVDVVGLPGPEGGPVPVVAHGLGDGFSVFDVSDISGVLPDGTHHDHLALKHHLGFQHVRLFTALGACAGPDCEVGTTTSFFADRVKFVKLVPEPGAALLLLAAAALGARRAARGAEDR